MGESRLEKGVKAAAWAVLAATVAALLAVGLLVQASPTAAPSVDAMQQDGAAEIAAPGGD